MTLALRFMTAADIPQVVNIDRRSFDPPWSAQSYAYEINESRYSHMVVLEQSHQEPLRGWRRWLHSFSGNGRGYTTRRQVVAYGGLWRIMEEAHISTIASHPDKRGRGYGEIVLAGMIRRSILLQASYVVLEVRVSNFVAQNLYRKYEFETVGVKENYYRNTNEDAYDMRLNIGDPALCERFSRRYAELQARYPFIDHYNSAG
jgi:ribosomal-protein-alanine N-acetyltransferase